MNLRMTINKIIILTLTLVAQAAMAQRMNKLWIADCAGTATNTIDVFVNLDNTDEVTAFQFDLTAPSGYNFGSEFVESERLGESHAVAVRLISANKARVIGYAADNSAIRGNAGALGRISLTIPANAAEGTEQTISITEATLGNRQMENTLTEAVDGKLTIATMPDIEVSGVGTSAIKASPGDEIPLRWTVSNIGTVALKGGWKETIRAKGADGRTATIYEGYADMEGLGGKAAIEREAIGKIPALPGIDGDITLEAEVTPGADSGESQSATTNNTASSAETFFLDKYLTLKISTKEIKEGGKAECTLTRSGSWAEAQTFTITGTESDRISYPATVTIPRGSSAKTFNVTAANNNLLDGNIEGEISIEGNGYKAVGAAFTIIDDEKPDFEISVVLDNVTEGKNFPLKIDLGCELPTATTVSFATSHPNRVELPKSVEIPAGTTSVTLPIPTSDSDEIDGNVTASIIATTELYGESTDAITIVDKDMPKLEMTLSSEVLHKGEESYYVNIKLDRAAKADIEIEMSDNSNGLLEIGSATAVIPAGETEAIVPLSVSDKTIGSTSKRCKLTAAVVIKSCNCSATAETSGHTSRELTIIDPSQNRLTLY
ncbi:MAG: cohesin domain-containing protein, partial [Lachnospiraceae bacterium]|nr:cohesin domain-containing protein [Lachnospiraceae bacterium]